MRHEIKINPENYEAIIEGRKPFEVRKNDRRYKAGDEVLLQEYEGWRYVEECGKYASCPYLEEACDIGFGEAEAIDNCGDDRVHCVGYTEKRYTGREIRLKIKEVFDLRGAGLYDYVAFTFEVLETRSMRPYISTQKEE